MSATQMRSDLLQNLSPFLGNIQAMQQINAFIMQLSTPSPCAYSIAEAQQRVQSATHRVLAGEHGISNSDFKSQVRSWYK